MFTTAKDCCRIMDMSITMISQAFNSLPYYRRRNALIATVGDKKKVKDMLLENIMKFDEKITEHVKLKKTSMGFFNIIDNKQPNNSINNGNNHQTFRSSPLPQQDRSVWRSYFFSYHQNHNKSGNRIGKSKFNSSIHCISIASPVNTKVSKGTSFSKKSIPYKNFPGAPFSREGKKVWKKLGKINKKLSCVEHSSWISNSFHRTPLSNFFTSGRKNCSRGKGTGAEAVAQMCAVKKVFL